MEGDNEAAQTHMVGEHADQCCIFEFVLPAPCKLSPANLGQAFFHYKHGSGAASLKQMLMIIIITIINNHHHQHHRSHDHQHH